MVEFFIHCPRCGRRFHIRLENKKMLHLERETYQRTDSSRHYRLSGSTFTVLREGPPITLDVEDFEDRYKCGHCGHEWTTYSLEIHREQPANAIKSDGTRPLPSRPGRRYGPKHSKLIIALLIVGLIATSAILGSAYTFNRFSINTCQNPTSNNLRYVRFTIVMSLNGWNDSIPHSPLNYTASPPWPIINVTIDSNVIIHVLNNDTSQYAHEFHITHYFEQGLSLQLGTSCNVVFLASISGAFPVYDEVVNEVYNHALLNVS